jgi:hypothetical protein
MHPPCGTYVGKVNEEYASILSSFGKRVYGLRFRASSEKKNLPLQVVGGGPGAHTYPNTCTASFSQT